jgi:MFS family permease
MALVPDQVEESRRGAISGILGFALPVAIVVGYVLMIIMANTSLAARFGVLGLVGIVSAVITCCMIVDPQTQYVKTGKKIAVNAIYPSPKKYPAFKRVLIRK